MKRHVKALLILLLAMIMLASGAQAETYVYDGTPVTLTFWHTFNPGTAEEAALSKIVNDFMEAYPSITVEMVFMTNDNTINTQLAADVAAGVKLPHLSRINVPRLMQYYESELIADLTPYIEATGYDIDDFVPGVIDALSVHGVQVAMPYMQSGVVFYYNKTLIEDELGLVWPTYWSELDGFLETVHAQTGKPVTMLNGGDNAFFYPIFTNAGAVLINEDGLTTGLDSEAAYDLIVQIKDWVDKGWFIWGYGNDTNATQKTNFTSGEVSSLFFTTTLYNVYKEEADFEIGMAMPLIDERTGLGEHYVAGGTLIMMDNHDQMEKNAAWLLIGFINNRENNLYFAEQSSVFPTRISVLNDDAAMAGYLQEYPALRVVFDTLETRYAKKVQHPLFDSVGDLAEDGLSEIMLDNVDVQAAWGALVDRINDYLQDN